MIRGTDSVARGSATGGRISSAAMSPWKRAVSAAASSRYGHAELARLGQDGVVDVGDVAHHAHLVAEVLEPADQEVVGEVGRRVPEVGRVVRRDPAHVHPHRVRRLERHDLAPRGVVEANASRLEPY